MLLDKLGSSNQHFSTQNKRNFGLLFGSYARSCMFQVKMCFCIQDLSPHIEVSDSQASVLSCSQRTYSEQSLSYVVVFFQILGDPRKTSCVRKPQRVLRQRQAVRFVFFGPEEPAENLVRAEFHWFLIILGILETPERNETIGIFGFSGLRNP